MLNNNPPFGGFAFDTTSTSTSASFSYMIQISQADFGNLLYLQSPLFGSQATHVSSSGTDTYVTSSIFGL